MDRKLVPTPFYKSKKAWLLSGLCVLFVAVMWSFRGRAGSDYYALKRDKISIEEVVFQSFEEYVPLDGLVIPLQIVRLDIIHGGQVEKIRVEDGQLVKAGDTLLHLNNLQVKLDFMNRESSLLDVYNNLQNTKLGLERQNFQSGKELLELERQLHAATDMKQRMEKLFADNAVSQKEYADALRQYEYLTRQTELAKALKKQDSLMAIAQVRQLEYALVKMESHMHIVRESISHLYVKSPVSGRITGFDEALGKQLQAGENIGEIDREQGYKVRAKIDERYLKDVFIGQEATSSKDGREIALKVKKVYPGVQNGFFEADFSFADSSEYSKVKKGQHLSIRLKFNETARALQVAKGGFYQSTSGRWAYVLNKDGSTAKKVEIQTGRQNPLTVEIMEGLKEGDRIIVSSYDDIGDHQILLIE